MLAIPLLAAACGTQTDRGPVATHGRAADRAAAVRVHGARACSTDLTPLGSDRTAYVGVAPQGAVALRDPGGSVLARFGPKNVNNYPTLFGIVGVVDDRDRRRRLARDAHADRELLRQPAADPDGGERAVRARRHRHLRVLERPHRLGAGRPDRDPRDERALVDRKGRL